MNQNTNIPSDTTQIPPCSSDGYVEAKGATPSLKHPTAAEIDLNEYRNGLQNQHHRGPREAGAANRYYGQPHEPNFTYRGFTYCAHEMTPEQLALYDDGYHCEADRKVW